MFFGRTERKKRHPLCALAFMALAVTGAMSITNGVMEFVKNKARCMAGFFRDMKKD